MDPARHAQNRNSLESIVRQIPGFRGYLEEEYRRESDFLVRQWLAEQLQLAKQALDQAMRRAVDAVQLDALPPFERLRGRIDGLMNQIRSADRGYSAVFSYVRTGEAELDQVLLVDQELTGDVTAFLAACQDLASGGNTASGAAPLDALQRQLEDLESKFRRRGEILRGLGK